MTLQKMGVDVSFAQGLDTKTDAKRVPTGGFVSLQNTIFNKGGLLQKRNGYAALSALPDSTYSYLTTLNGNLTAIGQNIAAYTAGNATWISKGNLQPVSLKTLPVLRNNLNQTVVDAAIGPNGLVCTVYLETDGTTTTNKYAISDSVTGQNIVAPTVIPVASGVVSGGMRVFVLANNFILVFTNTIAGTPHLQYVAIGCYSPTVVGGNVDLASSYDPATTLAWDGVVVGTQLYIGYNTTSGGQSVKITSLTSSFILASPVVFSGSIATMVSMCADDVEATPIIYCSFYDAGSSTGYTCAIDQNLNVVLAPVEIIATGTFLNLTSEAQNGVATIFGEVANTDTTTGLACNFIDSVTVTQAGVVGSPITVVRSVGLASKAFIINGVLYFLGIYSSTYQPTYFLINGSTSTDAAPVIAAKLAYQNGGGYLTKGLPGISISGTTASFPYLIKDLIQAVNKGTSVPAGSQVNGIYSQTGINLASLTFGTDGLDTSEIGNDLHITGGFLWMYDGYIPVEHNFFLYPDVNQTTPTDIALWSATGGSMAAQPDGTTNINAYFYQFTYEWTDNAGNAFRSAPSIPVAVTTTGALSTGSVTLNIPTLRLTMKTANPVKVVVYRWSVAQPSYYQATSITAPVLNNTTADYVTFVDTSADATILGNNLLYTTGGVIEDVNAPASDLLTIFDTRLWLVDAEDRNLLWFSKQVIEATPVEMSDLFTIYIPPTTATQGSTGPITAISVLDDKLIIYKQNAILYINGSGPDNTGANNQYSPPIFVTSTVGCANQTSIVLMPDGLMFQSDKGIWLLNRGISTSYIGAPVEAFTQGATVTSAVNVPETNQVRFTLDTGITLMYDYYYGVWSTFTGVPAIGSCIFQGVHTYIDIYGSTFQETPALYLDGSTPTLMQFKTGPLRLGDLQNYQRAYFFYLLGTYISPHKLVVNLYYDYSTSPSQTIVLQPQNFAPAYGSQPGPYGQGAYGASSNGYGDLEQFRVFLQQQRCQAVAIEVQEIFDPSFAVAAGAGLTLSGINILLGFKDKKPTLPAAISFG